MGCVAIRQLAESILQWLQTNLVLTLSSEIIMLTIDRLSFSVPEYSFLFKV